MIRFCSATLFLLTAAGAARAQSGGGSQPEGSRERVGAVVDSIAREAIRGEVLAGMVVIAVHRRDILLARGYGQADLENDVPMTVTHVFQLASITKQFTAAAVLALVQDGRVELDAPVRRYLPDAPVQGQAITVRQLLSHTAGIPDYAESPRIAALKRLDVPPDTLVALVATTPFYQAALGPPRQPAPGPAPHDLTIFAGRYGSDVMVSAIGEGATALRLTRGPLPAAELRYAGRNGFGWTFTDGRTRYTFDPLPPGASGSPVVWADLIVSLVRWERAR